MMNPEKCPQQLKLHKYLQNPTALKENTLKKKTQLPLFCWRVVFFPMFFLVIRNLVNRKKNGMHIFVPFFLGVISIWETVFGGSTLGACFTNFARGRSRKCTFFPQKSTTGT